MYTTKLVNSKSWRNKSWYKITQLLAYFVLIFFLLQIDRLWGKNLIESWYGEPLPNYTSQIVVAILLIFAILQSINAQRIKSPKNIGTLNISDDSFIVSINGEEQTFAANEINSVQLEYYSYIKRYNLAGCTNYITLEKGTEKKVFEIVIINDMERASLAEALESINKFVPISVKYTRYYLPIIKIKDFKNLKK